MGVPSCGFDLDELFRFTLVLNICGIILTCLRISGNSHLGDLASLSLLRETPNAPAGASGLRVRNIIFLLRRILGRAG